MCNTHYLRMRKYGDPSVCHARGWDYSLEQRFEERVDRNGPVPLLRPDLGSCWLWTAGHNGNGYATFGNHLPIVYRWGYETFVKAIPEGLVLDHLCHTVDPTCPGGDTCPHRGCVNYETHLEVVTFAENVRRGRVADINGRKTHCPYGHEYTPENTYIDPSGRRHCRTCRETRASKRIR